MAIEMVHQLHNFQINSHEYKKVYIVLRQTLDFMNIYIFHKWAASWQNQQNGMCAQRRLRSAWASAQSDQSLCCPHEESMGP